MLVNGLAPRDEYDDYAMRVAETLQAGAGRRHLIDYLARVRREQLLAAPDPRRDGEVVDRIMALRA